MRVQDDAESLHLPEQPAFARRERSFRVGAHAINAGTIVDGAERAETIGAGFFTSPFGFMAKFGDLQPLRFTAMASSSNRNALPRQLVIVERAGYGAVKYSR